MNWWGYLHLAVNHFPIISTIIGMLILLAGLIFKNEGIKLSGLGTMVFAAIMAVPAILTGDSAAEAVKGLPDVLSSLVEKHEDIAYVGLWSILPMGIIAGLAIYSLFKKEKMYKSLVITAFVLSVLVSGVMIYVGRTGGKIRHSEFRNFSAPAKNQAVEAADAHD